MALLGLLATVSISFSVFPFLGTNTNDDISVDYIRYSSYGESSISSSRIDDFDRFVLDCYVGVGYLIQNADLDAYTYFIPLQVWSLYLPYYEDAFYYDLYFTLDDYSIYYPDSEHTSILFRWSYDIETFCFDNSLGTEYLKSIQTRSLEVDFGLEQYSDYNIDDYSLFVDLLMSNFPKTISFTVDCQEYFSVLNELYNSGYDEGLSESFQSGYDSGYNEGYDEGFDWGQELGYNQGLSEGSSSSLANPFDIIRSALKGPLDFLMLEIAPNITIGTILLIPLSITILVFLLKGLVK